MWCLLALCALGVMLGRCASEPREIQPQVTPQRYTYYLPMVARAKGLWGKGVASTSNGAYIDKLGATWYYTWGFCDARRCVPMMRSAKLPPSCPPILLYLNEPNSIEPYGATTPPEFAAQVSLAIRAQCPSTWIVAGNVAYDWFGMRGEEWLTLYFAAGGVADQVGVHCYVSPNGTVAQCHWLDDWTTRFGRPLCVTEFGIGREDVAEYARLVEYVAKFRCYAAFTDKDARWDIYGFNFNLIGDDNERTPHGDVLEQFEMAR